MTAKEFAEKYAGQVAVITDGPSKGKRGRIIAWQGNHVVIEDVFGGLHTKRADWINFNLVVDGELNWSGRIAAPEKLQVTGKPTFQHTFPHKCPRCSSPAYVGFTAVECSKNCQGRK